MSYLVEQGGFGCVYFPGITCSGKKSEATTTVTKLQVRNFNSVNEFEIGKTISKIPNYIDFFVPVKKMCQIDLRLIQAKMISKCDIIEKGNQEYVLMKMPFIENADFYHYFSNLKSKREIVRSLIETYKHLLICVDHLQEVQIVHFDIKVDNILYNMNTKLPNIIDFGISIPISEISDKNIGEYFYDYIPEYVYWTPEVHLLCYLIHITETSLSKKDINTIVHNFMLTIDMSIFNENEKKKYLLNLKNEMKKYIALPRNEVIQKVLSYWKTWDNYSLSVIYIILINYLYAEGNVFLSKFKNILLENIQPNPELRLTIERTQVSFNDIFYQINDIVEYKSIVEKMNVAKLSMLRKLTKQMDSRNERV